MGILAAVPLGTGAGADANFVAGSGRARANLFEIIPRTGGLEIPINFGKALVTYQGLSATATSGGLKPPSQNAADGGLEVGCRPLVRHARTLTPRPRRNGDRDATGAG